MMDGRIGEIRVRWNSKGTSTPASSAYSAKYAVQLLRAVPRCGRFGRGASARATSYTYQMDPANSDEALREVALDLDEGRGHE
jgi:porphobilinogen synthase